MSKHVATESKRDVVVIPCLRAGPSPNDSNITPNTKYQTPSLMPHPRPSLTADLRCHGQKLRGHMRPNGKIPSTGIQAQCLEPESEGKQDTLFLALAPPLTLSSRVFRLALVLKFCPLEPQPLSVLLQRLVHKRA